MVKIPIKYVFMTGTYTYNQITELVESSELTWEIANRDGYLVVDVGNERYTFKLIDPTNDKWNLHSWI
jgi:hypothetical protein